MIDYDREVMSTVEAALRSGGVLHAFLSGGGLRVLTIERQAYDPDEGQRRVQLAYGEHPYVGDAFRILADDFKAGCRPYEEVYGKTETHYLTGASEPQDDLDAWVRRGAYFDARADGDGFEFELRGYQEHKTPEDIDACARKGRTVRWTDARGFAFVASPYRFPNGDVGYSTKVTACPAGRTDHEAFLWKAVRRGTGKSLLDAIRAAFEATAEECSDSHT